MMKALKNIWNDPVWSKVIAAIVTLLLQNLISIVVKSPLLSVGIVAAVVLLISIVALLARALSGISIGAKERFLAHGGGPSNYWGFKFLGKSRSRRPIRKVGGRLESLITNDTYRIYFSTDEGILSPEDTNGIPPEAAFCIIVPFARDETGRYIKATDGNLDTSKGYDRKKLMECLSDSLLYIEADGRSYRYRISRASIQAEIERIENMLNPIKGSRMSRKLS